MSFNLRDETIKNTSSRLLENMDVPASDPSYPISSDGVTCDERGFSLVEPLHVDENA